MPVTKHAAFFAYHEVCT